MIIPSITPLPPSPQRTDPSTFAARADASLTAQETVFTPELNAFASAVNVTQTEMTALSTNATNQALSAALSATAAAASALAAGATIWVSGTTYAIGNARYSPINGQVYRRLTAGAGTTDPSLDSTNWIVVNGLTSEAIVLPVNNLPLIRPSLLLDFANSQTVDPRITFTRASTATRTNARGLIEAVASGVPRIDFDAVTGVCKGLLIEEQRANLILQSEAFDNAAWTKVGTCTVTANAAVSPDGLTTSDILNLPASVDRVTQSCAVTGSTIYTFSAVLSGTGTVYLSLSSSGGVYVFAGLLVTLTPTPSRYSLQITTNSGNTALFSTIGRYDGNVAAGTATACTSWGAQLEAGAFPTSYIPTVASQVTRAADVASMTGANFSSWYRSDEGSFVAIASAAFDSSSTIFPYYLTANDGTLSNRIGIGQRTNDDTIFGTIVVSGVSQADFSATSSATYSTPNNIALTYKVNDAAIARSGILSQTDSLLTLPVVNQMSIGSSPGANTLNGHIRSISYYPKRLTNLELQALSTQ